MNILFLTMGKFDSIEAHSIYADLLRCFRNHGHKVWIISPNEVRTGKETELVDENGAIVLHVKTGNVTGKNNIIKKGLAQLFIEHIYIRAVKKYFSNVKFDVVLYSTPPITFCKVVEFIKKRDASKSYLLLKDIFPQNAVDLGMMSKKGMCAFIYNYFRNKEKRLYRISDRIGCMSEENVRYILKHNSYIDSKEVEVCPNAIDIIDMSVDYTNRKKIRQKYNIPNDKTVFVYGGNIGKPQGVQFLIECFRKAQYVDEVFFLVVGNGSEYERLKQFITVENPKNVELLREMPKDDYDEMVGACDVGLIFLDHRFTIPNFPSRILSYMQAKLPVLAVTDPNTDIGTIIVNGGFGWWCESNDSNGFVDLIKQIVLDNNLKAYGDNAWQFLNENYEVEKAYNIITQGKFIDE